MYNYLNRFTRAISDAESSILKEYKNNVGDLKKLNKANKEVTITNLGDLDFDTFFNVIINDKPYLSNDREYIKNIFDEVRSYVLKDDTPRKGETVKIIGNFDLNLYLSDSGYQAVVKKYYNLLKRTFNIFDIVEDVPHFKEMINSLKMSNHMLQTIAAKYKFTTKTLAETIQKHSHALDKNGKTKYVEKKNLLRGSNYFDVKAIETWLKTDRMSKFTFNVSNLLKQANIDEIVLFTSDSAINNPDQVEIVNQNSDFIVSLDTNYGIANFKRIMEQIILPLLQSYDSSNMTENLRVETVNNLFGLKTNSIISAYSLKSLNSPVAIHQFNSLLSAFNSLDSNIQTEGKIKNAYGEELK
jgi:vacuolar-type H+-ATPase subunit I/STV1